MARRWELNTLARLRESKCISQKGMNSGKRPRQADRIVQAPLSWSPQVLYTILHRKFTTHTSISSASQTLGTNISHWFRNPVLPASPHARLQPISPLWKSATSINISHYVEPPENALIHIHHEIEYRSSVVSSNTMSMSVLWQA
jgi:hypothetical protein